MKHLNTCFSPFMIQDLMRKHAKIQNHSSKILLLLILLTFLSYMTSNKNSIDSLNEMLLLYTSLIAEIHTLFPRFHQCKIIKCTCHYFMLSCLISKIEFRFFFQRIALSYLASNYHRLSSCFTSRYITSNNIFCITEKAIGRCFQNTLIEVSW